VLQTVETINTELEICAAMSDRGEFSRGIRLEEKNYYRWPWPRSVATDIKPLANSFEYIDGAFRPDTRRLLALLAGTRLYRTPLVALREIIQNSFDAVKEQIAQELIRSFAASDETKSSLEALHSVSLHVEKSNDCIWIVCSDTGVGMTRRVIEKHLLISGSRPRPELLALERACISKGFRLERVGEFGIGILSYFMLGDNRSSKQKRVLKRTRIMRITVGDLKSRGLKDSGSYDL
jgi:hypothetical protein